MQTNQQNIQSDLTVEIKPLSAEDKKALEIREKLQQDIVAMITRMLESGEMTEDRAKAIAKMTLSKLPEGITYRELMKVVPTIDDEFEELRFAVYPIISEYQEKTAARVQIEISRLIKEKKLGQALQLANQSIMFEQSLG